MAASFLPPPPTALALPVPGAELSAQRHPTTVATQNPRSGDDAAAHLDAA